MISLYIGQGDFTQRFTQEFFYCTSFSWCLLRHERFPDRALPCPGGRLFLAERRIATRRAGWGGLLTAVGTAGYYVAYAYMAWRTLHGAFTIGVLTFLAGSFRRAAT